MHSKRSLQISLFRQLRIERDGQADPVKLENQKARELFCYLLVYRTRPHTRSQLGNVLWESSASSQAKQYLRQALWQLQSAVNDFGSDDSPLVSVNQDWIRIDLNPRVFLDLDVFEQAYERVKGVSGRVLDAQSVAMLETAVDLYRGDLLENWYQDWCIFERERLQNIYLAMLEKLVHYSESKGAYEAGIFYGTRILKCDRAHERTYRSLMRLQYHSGNRVGALRLFERCQEVLREELDVSPSRSTAILYTQIKNEQFPRQDELDVHQPEPDAQPPSTRHLLEELLRLKRALFKTQQDLEQAVNIAVGATSSSQDSAPFSE